MGIFSAFLSTGIIIFTGALIFSFIMFIRENREVSTQTASNPVTVNIGAQAGLSCFQCDQPIKPEYKYCPACCTNLVKEEPLDKTADAPAKDEDADSSISDKQKEEVSKPENNVNTETELTSIDDTVQEHQLSSDDMVPESETGFKIDSSFSHKQDGVTKVEPLDKTMDTHAKGEEADIGVHDKQREEVSNPENSVNAEAELTRVDDTVQEHQLSSDDVVPESETIDSSLSHEQDGVTSEIFESIYQGDVGQNKKIPEQNVQKNGQNGRSHKRSKKGHK